MTRLRYIREHRRAIEALIESSTATRPFANHLRALLDPRPLTERIRDSVLDARGAMRLRHDPGVPSLVQAHIELHLDRYPIDRAPCRKLISEILEADEHGISAQNSTSLVSSVVASFPST